MRAVTFSKPGPPEVLEVTELPDLEPGAGELLVRNFATSLNRADLLQRRGYYPPPPGDSDILGLEFAGEVAEAGKGARAYQRGDRVFGLIGGGGYAEQVVVDERLAMPIPDNLSFDAAAAGAEVFMTAYEALIVLGAMQAGERVLVHAGGSGVGAAAIQLACSFGGDVLTTAGSKEKLERCLQLGAQRGVNYREEDFADVVREASGGEGVDLILDLVGAKYWEKNLRSLRPGGRLLLIGLLGGAQVTADLWTLMRRRIQVIGTVLRSRSRDEKVLLTRRFVEHVLPRLETGELRPIVDRVYPLEEVRAAHERMEQNLNFGKIVMRF